MAVRSFGRGNKSGNSNGKVIWPVVPQISDDVYQYMKKLEEEFAYNSGFTDLQFITMNKIKETKKGRWEIYSNKVGSCCAIVNNIHDGACLTILDGKRIVEFARHLCDSQVTGEFLGFLYGRNAQDSHALIEWLISSTPDQVEGERLMFSLTKNDKV